MINLIVACDLNNGIGASNKLLCTLKDDMKHFKEMTTGHYVVMGRRTFESIGKALPNRANVVLTRDSSQSAFYGESLLFANSMDDIIKLNHMFPSKPIFIIGGEDVYKQFLPFASKIYLTRINHTFEEADAFFPELHMPMWKIVDEKYYEKNDRNEYDFYISTLERLI